VRAPFAGVLGIRQVSPGTLLTPTTVIATLDDIEHMHIDFQVPEVELAVYDERGMESIRNFGLRMYMEDPLTTANLGKIFVD